MRDGNGTYSAPGNSWNPAVDGTDIDSSDWNDVLTDIEAALTASIAKDGQTVPTANLPMGGFKHTGVANAAAVTEYAAYGQVQKNSANYAVAASSTTNYVVTLSPAVSALTNGMRVTFKAPLANASAATLTVGTASAKSIRTRALAALSSGMISAGSMNEAIFDGTYFQLVSSSPAAAGNGLTALTASANQVVGFNASAVAAKFSCTVFARTVLDDGTAASARTTLSAAKLGHLEGVNTVTTGYTLALTDIGKVVEMNDASSRTITVPASATVAFAVGARVDVVRYGAGAVTIAAATGVTIRSRGSALGISTQYAGASLYKRASNEWVCVGDLA
jgi:hypothetical protein